MDEDATRMPQVGCKQTQLGILISYKIHRNTAKPKIHILRTRFLELRIHSSTPVPWEVEHGPGLDFGEHLWRSPNPGNEALREAGHGRSFRYSSSLLQGAKAFQQRARKSKACHLSGLNAGGAFGAHGNGASSIEYCICLINIKPSFRVFAPWFFRWKSIKPWILWPYKSNVNPSDAVTLVLWCYSSMGNLLPHWCYSTVCTALYDMFFCIKLVWWYGRNLPPLQSSPCHGILSSGQRAKAFRDVKGESTQADCQTRRSEKNALNKKGAN